MNHGDLLKGSFSNILKTYQRKLHFKIKKKVANFHHHPMKPTYTTIENLHWILTKPFTFTKEWKSIHIYTKPQNVIPLHHIFESFQLIKANYNSHQPIDHNLLVLPKPIEKLFPYPPSCCSRSSQNAPTHLSKAPNIASQTPPHPPPQSLTKAFASPSMKSHHLHKTYGKKTTQ